MDEQQVETELADSPPARHGGPWKLIILVVALTLIGIWLVPGHDGDQTAGINDGDIAPSLLDLPPTGAGGSPALPDALQEPPMDDRPGARARALIAAMRSTGELQLDRVFEAAEEAHDDGRLADAYLLHFFAAREGHAPSALILGSQADPVSRNPGDSLFEDADLTQAHKWYQVAASNGDAEGRKRLDELRERVERMAAGGDPQAKRIALLWQ